MNGMTKKEQSRKIVRKLKKMYGEEIPLYLHYHKNKKYEFLFAVMLSAQCTDERVNEVTKDLYKKYTSLRDFANADIKQLENDIYATGFYHNKAKGIKGTAIILLEKFKGKVPDNFDELIKLPGVGRKTANVVLGNLYGIQSMAVDTHVNRISNKLFTLNEKNSDKVCDMLEKIVDKKDWTLWNTHIIALGRTICTARNPKCNECFIRDLCDRYNY